MKSAANFAVVAALLAAAACSSGSGSPSTQPGATVQPAPAATSKVTPTAVSGNPHPAVTKTSTITTRSPRPSASQAASSRPTAPRDVAVGTEANGKTFRIVVGQHLRVHLAGAGWTGPSASRPTVLRRTSTEQRHQWTRAVFHALRKGTSTVSASRPGGKTWLIRVVVG